MTSNELVLGVGLFVALLGMFLGLEVLRDKFGLETEYTRKLAHLLGGLGLIGLPWMFDSLVVPAMLGVAFFAILYLSKRTGTLVAIHGVTRESNGASLFPIAAFATLIVAWETPLAYASAMSVLAVSDTAAAMVGRRYGRNLYFIGRQSRSLEGSFAFLITATAVMLPWLLAGGLSVVAALGLALLVALLVTGLEAISIGGFDNLVIPLATVAFLEAFSGLSAPVAWAHFALLLSLLGGAAIAFRTRGIGFAAALSLYASISLSWQAIG